VTSLRSNLLQARIVATTSCIALALAASLVGPALAATPPAAAKTGSFAIRDTGAGNLDGRTVMSPSAERIVTTEPEGGELIGPGMTVTRAVVITNRTKAPITFSLTLAQVVGTRDGQTVDIRRGVIEGAAGWASIERPVFTLKPGEQALDPVTISIPARVTPGSKSFAVIATQATNDATPKAAGVATQFEQVGIYTVELPGDVPNKGSLTKAEVTSAQKNLASSRDGRKPAVNSRFYVGPGLAGKHRLTLSTEYQNDGERLLQPTGTVVVKDLFGRIAGRYTVPRFTVYPGGSSTGQVELRGLPSLGIYSTTVELKTDVGTQKTTLHRFVLVPKWLLAALVVLTGMLVVRLVRWRAERRDASAFDDDLGSASHDAHADPGVDVDADYDIDWSVSDRDG
jgi:hypothetical protein